MIQIPQQDLKIGQQIEYDGKQLIADKEFFTGASFKSSGYKYFTNSHKGVIGLKELNDQ